MYSNQILPNLIGNWQILPNHIGILKQDCCRNMPKFQFQCRDFNLTEARMRKTPKPADDATQSKFFLFPSVAKHTRCCESEFFFSRAFPKHTRCCESELFFYRVFPKHTRCCESELFFSRAFPKHTRCGESEFCFWLVEAIEGDNFILQCTPPLLNLHSYRCLSITHSTHLGFHFSRYLSGLICCISTVKLNRFTTAMIKIVTEPLHPPDVYFYWPNQHRLVLTVASDRCYTKFTQDSPGFGFVACHRCRFR